MISAIRERPILFSAPMVRALLAGTKTQTRRVIKSARYEDGLHHEFALLYSGEWGVLHGGVVSENMGRCPYGCSGDRLWVKETSSQPGGSMHFRADDDDHSEVWKWKPSIFMRRCESRITLDITEVRVERLNDISEADAIAEGAHRKIWITSPMSAGAMNARGDRGTHRDGYKDIWEEINGAGSWALNPWVWVITFNTQKHETRNLPLP